jgi:cupin 2 domain-containing protein
MNLYTLPTPLPADELTELLAAGTGVRIERIISCGQASPPGFWYDQDGDEWVVLLQGEAVLAYADGRRASLATGDWLLIPAHEKHRVESTSTEPPCIWLAVHASLR